MVANIIRLVVFYVLFAPGYALPVESLPALVAQLQRNPQDDALRGKVIRLALDTKPVPAIPPEALRHGNSGKALLMKAKNRQDYLVAAREYELALQLAPWSAPLYYSLAEVYEKVSDAALADPVLRAQVAQSCSMDTYDQGKQRFEGDERARQNFEFYLLAKANHTRQDADMVRRRIEERKMRFALWRYQWDAACCLGCGGKQEPIKQGTS